MGILHHAGPGAAIPDGATASPSPRPPAAQEGLFHPADRAVHPGESLVLRTGGAGEGGKAQDLPGQVSLRLHPSSDRTQTLHQARPRQRLQPTPSTAQRRGTHLPPEPAEREVPHPSQEEEESPIRLGGLPVGPPPHCLIPRTSSLQPLQRNAILRPHRPHRAH